LLLLPLLLLLKGGCIALGHGFSLQRLEADSSCSMYTGSVSSIFGMALHSAS
jgi:hypothetical protein